MSSNAATDLDRPQSVSPREQVAKWMLVVCGAILALTVLGVIIAALRLNDVKESGETFKYLFSALLPLIGTWVGTILAYYFSKDNFDAATQAQRQIVRDLTQERLRTIPVETAMIPKAQIDAISLSPGQAVGSIPVADIVGIIKDKKRTRVPVLDSGGVAQLVLHQSIVYRFIAESGEAIAQAQARTLDSLLGFADTMVLANAFAFVARSATLADAKAAMDQKAHAQDVFVTANGQAGEPILGWLTNVDIARNSRA